MAEYVLISGLSSASAALGSAYIPIEPQSTGSAVNITVEGLFENLSTLRTTSASGLVGRTDSSDYNAVHVGTGLIYSGSVISGSLATTSVKGVASFDSDHFTVSSGAVSITNVATTGTIPIDHDRLENFVSNEHIDHTGVTINTSGTGLSGGGTIETNRTITLDSSTSTGTNNKVPLTNASGGGSGNGYLNNFVQNLLYIQAVGKDNDVTASTITSYFFVPNYLANKSIKRMGIGYTGSQPTSSTVQIRNNTTAIVSQSTTSSAIYAEGDVSGTMPPLGTKLNVYVSAISGATPKGLDVWILVG